MTESRNDAADGARGTVLVTGGSRGIGLELARCFATDGHPLALVARDQETLAEAAEELEEEGAPSVRTLSADLTEDGAAGRIWRALDGAAPPVDVVVNNAGFSTHGPFHTADPEAQGAMVRVMVEALTVLSRRFLGDMVERGRGGILNVASTAAFQPGPRQAVYFAAKAYVLSLTKAVAHELRDTPIRVSVLCPGPTDTAFLERAEMEETRLAGRGGVRLMSPQRVAEAGYRGWKRGERVVVPGVLNRLGAVGARLAPDALNLRLVDWLESAPE